MLICLDFIQVSVEDIPLGTEMSELGAWLECKMMFDKPIVIDQLCNKFPIKGEVNKLDS